jgi:hypothetical protein
MPMPYDDQPFYHLEPDDEPVEHSAYFWATFATVALGFWLFVIIGFCDVVHGLWEAVRRFFA